MCFAACHVDPNHPKVRSSVIWHDCDILGVLGNIRAREWTERPSRSRVQHMFYIFPIGNKIRPNILKSPKTALFLGAPLKKAGRSEVWKTAICGAAMGMWT